MRSKNVLSASFLCLNCQVVLALGLHIEGPFISHEKRGAHLVQCIRQLDGGMRDVLETYGSLDDAAIITLAPELPNANDVIRELVKSGITVSLGLYEALFSTIGVILMTFHLILQVIL